MKLAQRIKNFAQKITPWKVLSTVLGVALFAVVLMGVSEYYITEAVENRHQQAFSAMQAASEQGKHQQVIEFSSIVDRDKLTREQIYTYDAAFAKALKSIDNHEDSLSIFHRLSDNYVLTANDAIFAAETAEEAEDASSTLYFYQLALSANETESVLEEMRVKEVQQKIEQLQSEVQE